MDDENDVNLLLRSQETLPLVFSQLQDVVLTQKQVMDSIYSEVMTYCNHYCLILVPHTNTYVSVINIIHLISESSV